MMKGMKNFGRGVLVVVFLLAVVCVNNVRTDGDFNCESKPDGCYPDLKDCRKFCQCVEGAAIRSHAKIARKRKSSDIRHTAGPIVVHSGAQ